MAQKRYMQLPIKRRAELKVYELKKSPAQPSLLHETKIKNGMLFICS